jgi:demethylphylloquinone reductase
MTDPSKKICILGGGFGGLYTALRLSQLPWTDQNPPQITLIDKSDRFLFSPLLYELVTSELQSWEIAPPFSELLADTPINFQQGTVTAIDINNNKITLDNQTDICYDRLVIALGGQSSLDFVSGARTHAIPFRRLEDAYRLQDKLKILEQSNRDKIRVAIIGAGYSGVELACKISDRLGERGRIRLIEKNADILALSAKFNQETAKKSLEKRHVWLDLETTVTEIQSDSISLDYKGQLDTIPVDLVLWTVSPIISDLIANLPLAHGERKLLKVNQYLQTPENPSIYVVGDVADSRDSENKIYAATAQVAIQQSDYCAWNIWASFTDKPALPFRYQPLGEMLTLGIDEATISGLGLQLEGVLAHLTRRLVYLYRLPTLKHQIAVGLNWITQPILSLIGED